MTLYKELRRHRPTTARSHKEGQAFRLDAGVHQRSRTTHPGSNIQTGIISTELVQTVQIGSGRFAIRNWSSIIPKRRGRTKKTNLLLFASLKSCREKL